MAKKYIEVKGPFQIRNKEAASRISKEILRLAKKHPSAKFILRESHRKQGSGSVYSAAFQTLTKNDMGDRIHVEKAKHGRGYAHLGPPSKVREGKIAKLGAFKVAEFTFSGKVPSAEYKAWREVDISISKEKTWDPLRTKGQHLVSFGYKPEKVKKYVGGTASASKKVDAYIDRVSEYGRKKGAKQTSVDIAIEYIQDKSDEFAETQRYQNPSAEPIHMLSKARQTRLERLRKNYGTIPVQTGKVNIEGAGKKKIVPQVPIQTDPHKIYRSNIATSTKEKFKGEAKRGLPGTGFRESGTSTSFEPVGIASEINPGREFDEDAVMSHKDDAPRYPTHSSERVTFPADQKPLKNVKPIKFPAITTAGKFDPKNRKYTQFGESKTPKPETLSVAQKKEYRKHGLKVPTNVVPIIQPFSQISSGLIQWDKYKSELDSSHSITPSDEFKKSSFESPDIASADKGGGGNMQTHTDEFIDRKAQGMRDDLSNIEKKPWLIDSVKVGDTKKATKTTTITDVLYGDGTEHNPATGTQDKAPSSTSPRSVSDPIEPYKEKLPDLPPGVRKTKKPESRERKHQRRLENLKTETTNISIHKNKKGEEYFRLNKNPGYDKEVRTKHTLETMSIEEQGRKEAAKRKEGSTRAQQIKKNYVEFRNKAVKDFNVKIAAGETTSKVDTSDVTSANITKGTHSPQRTFSLAKKAPPKGVTAGSMIRGAFKLGGILSVGIAPLLAVKEVKAAGAKLTPANIGQETARFMLGSDRVWSGVGAKNKGYFQKVGPTTKGVEGGRRPIKPIPGAGGPNTPYAKLKKSVSGAMIEWSKASSKASEALKYRRVK